MKLSSRLGAQRRPSATFARLPPTLAALVLVVAAATGAHGAGDEEYEPNLSYEELAGLCAEIEGISPPPPPFESALAGTFDAATGGFTWGPQVVQRFDFSSYVRDLRAVLDAHDIRAVTVALDPVIGSIGDLGLRVDMARLRQPAVRARPISAGAPLRRTARPPGGSTAQPATSGGGLQGHSTETKTFHLPVRAAKVGLVFEVVNRPRDATFQVTLGGQRLRAPGDTADGVVPPCLWVDFTVSCAGKSFADRLYIDRPPLIGCFTLEALPVTIVYEPPGSKSSQEYTTTHQVGTVVKSFRGSTTTETQPVDTPFSRVGDFIALVRGAGGAATAFGYPEAGEGLEKAADALEKIWGSSETHESVAHSVTEDHELAITVTEEHSVSTSTHAGPGKGDVLHYFVKPVLGWLAIPSEESGKVYVTTALLGYRRVVTIDAETLRSGTVPEPHAEALRLLLAQDPLTPEYREVAAAAPLRPRLSVPAGVGGGGASGGDNPAPGRFVPATDFEVEFAGVQATYFFRRTIEEADTRSQSVVKTRTTKEVAGYLSYISKDVPQDGEKSISTVQGSSERASTSDTVEVKVTYGAESGERYLVHTYYDRLYGTFAFVPVEQPAMEQVTGEVTDEEGQQAVGQPVEIETEDGMVTATRTDLQGRYAFRSAILKPGNHTLIAGGKRVPLRYTGEPVRGLKLRAPRKDLDAARARATTPSAAGVAAVLRGDPLQAAAALAAEIAELEARVERLERLIAAAGPPAAKEGPRIEQVPAPELKGRMGRLVVSFPPDVKLDDEVYLYNAGEKDTYSTWSRGGLDVELITGTYAIAVHKRRVEGLEIEARHLTRVLLGALRIHAAPETEWHIYEPGGKAYLTWGKGAAVVGLVPGSYEVEVTGQRAAVVVEAGGVAEF